MMNSQTISVAINRPPADVYEFASNPENLPQWVRSFCLSVNKSGDDWFMETPGGPVGIRFVPPNEFGVLDHVVTLPDGRSILNPMRVVPNGEGSEVMFTLFQLPTMTDDEFAHDSRMVEVDLRTLQQVLENSQVWLTLDGEIRDEHFLKFLERVGEETLDRLDPHDFLILGLIAGGKRLPARLQMQVPHALAMADLATALNHPGLQAVAARSSPPYRHRGVRPPRS